MRELRKQVKPTTPAPEAHLRGQQRRSMSSLDGVREVIPSGRLALSIPHHVGGWGTFRIWSDPRPGKQGDLLEQQLDAVIGGIVDAATEYRRVIADWQQKLEREREAANRAAETQRIQVREAALAKEIERQANSWQLSRLIRCYIAELSKQLGRDPSTDGENHVANAAGPLPIVPPGLSTTDWIAWAEAYADRVDPLRH
ncbi:MAG TPA: hypothetical protein VNV25_05785 [Gemmatimonadaceae bacterium]|jgi:hypothetical protein|nr:hypothetical protein [Gemmatimonadaceae bacterium]